MRVGLAIAVWLLAAGVSAQSVATGPAPANRGRVVRQGVVTDFSIAPAAGKPGLMEGEEAVVKFRLTDEATGNPLNALSPGAWINPGDTMQGRDGQEP